MGWELWELSRRSGSGAALARRVSGEAQIVAFWTKLQAVRGCALEMGHGVKVAPRKTRCGRNWTWAAHGEILPEYASPSKWISPAAIPISAAAPCGTVKCHTSAAAPGGTGRAVAATMAARELQGQ